MKQFIHRQLAYCVYMTLACWLLASMGSVHAHLCLDGQEPPISYASGVLDHPADQDHKDVDVSLTKLVMVKLFKLDLPIVLAVLALLILSSLPRRHVSHREILSSFHSFFLLRPPLRAPPAFPA